MSLTHQEVDTKTPFRLQFLLDNLITVLAHELTFVL
jgi:hypothetical protein